MKKHVLLDSSVIISACYSFTGASALIIDLCIRGILKGYITNHIIEETRKNTTEKMGLKYKEVFERILKKANFILLSDPSITQLSIAEKAIASKDLPILASALSNDINYLITHDKKDFISKKIKGFDFDFEIMIPGKFIMLCRDEGLV